MLVRQTLRRVAHRLSRDVVVPRRLPREWGRGRIYVTPDAALGLLKPNLEDADPLLFRLVRAHVSSGQIVWDIGANCGLFSLTAASRGASVVAVEADPWLASLIRRSAAANQHPVDVLPAAVADGVGVVRFAVAAIDRAQSHIAGAHRTGRRAVRDTFPVPATTLDAMLDSFPAPSLVKVDVEGAEALVLRGASRLLREARPTLILEVGKEASDEVTATLLQAGYALYDAETGASTTRSTWMTLARPHRGVTKHKSP